MGVRDNYWTTVAQRRLSRRTALRSALGGSVGVSLALAGCGGGDDDGGTDLDTLPTADPTKQAEVQSILIPREDTSAKATKGGILTSYYPADTANLDPLAAPSYTGAWWGNYYYPRLLSYKPGYKVNATGEVQAYLGEKWEQPEPTKVVFTLRKNAVWEDSAPTNKRAITADDVKFSWDKFAAKAISRKDLAKAADNPNGPVESLTVIDKNTIEFKLAAPYAPLMSALAYSRYLQVMPVESESGYDPRNETRSGGPWMLSNYQRSVKYELRKNPNFWDADKVHLDGWDYPIIAEASVLLAQFKAKKLSIYAPLAEDLIATKKELPEVGVDKLAFNRTNWLIYFGLKDGSPFRDKRVRQAASMLLDRDLWIDTFGNVTTYKKEGYPIETRWNSHISSGWEGLWLDPKKMTGDAAKVWQFNVAEAKKLMEAAGFANGIETEIAWISTGQYGQSFPRHSEVFKGMFEATGLFKLKQVNPDYQTQYLPNYYFGKGNFDGIVVGASTTYPEVDQYLFAYYHSQGARQKVAFQGTVTGADAAAQQESERLIMAQRQELNAQKRTTLIQDWQKHQAEYMPMIPYPGQANAFWLGWPWAGNWGVFRAWDASGETDRETVETKYWFDKSKYTG